MKANEKQPNINSQKTLDNFFTKHKDKESEEKCSFCGGNYLSSKISWHRDFDCSAVKRNISSSDNSSYMRAKRKMKSKCKVNTSQVDTGSTSSHDVILLDDLDEADLQKSTFEPDKSSSVLFDLSDISDNEDKQGKEKNTLIDELKKDWNSPSNSPIKPLAGSSENSKLKYENSSSFSVLSSTNSENEFENDIAFSSPPRNCRKNTKKKGKVKSGEHEQSSSIEDHTLDTEKSNVIEKSEIGSVALLVETVFSDASNHSCDDFLLNTPALVSPERTPTPSPSQSARKSEQKLNISSQILYSPERFNLKRKLSDFQNEGSEQKLPVINKSNIKKTPKSFLDSAKKANFKNGYLPNNSFAVRRSLFTNSNNNLITSPTKKFTNSPSKYQNEKGMYLHNFLHIIDIVTLQPQDLQLFDNDDLKYIHNFHELSLQAQKLYVRLFQRKVRWNKVSKIEYKEICDKEDIALYINELVYAEFLLAECHLTTLKDLLSLLDANEARTICKDMKLQSSGTKEVIISRLLKSDRQQISISTFCSSKRNGSQIFEKSRKLVGKCFIIRKEVWNVFMRILHLYSPVHFDEDEESGHQTQLTTLLMVTIGKMKFPSYNVIREHSIYKYREDLIRYQTFMQIESEIQEYMKNQNWEEAIETCKAAEVIFSEIENDQDMLKHDASLPLFLRRFTTTSLMCHFRTTAVEIYQRQKHYGKAVKQLEQLLAQKTHRQDCRGRWYDRLALNLHQHLKKPGKALSAITEALNDPEVRVGHRLSLSQRAERILNSKATQKYAAEYEHQLHLMEYEEAPRVCIQGKCLPADIPGYKRIFLSSEEGKECDFMCSVEELALNHYKKEGYPKGLHSEGRVIAALFGFFFWDILYLPLPDVFRTTEQAAPLDLDTIEFYEKRKKAIDNRLHNMRKWALDEAEKFVEKVWNENENVVCLIDWKLFSSLEMLQGLISGLGLKVIAAICERLAKDHRFTRSGFPDLVVWNPLKKKSRIVEVKGPNDKLSTKQILWLDFLIANGAEAEVCHVEAVGQKRTGVLKSKRVSPRKKKAATSVNSPKKSRKTSESPPKSKGRAKRQRKN